MRSNESKELGLFDESGIQAIETAGEEAKRLGHNFIGTELLLLGLVGQRTKASFALNEFGLNLKRTRNEVEHIIGRGSGYVEKDIPITPRARKLFEPMVQDAKAGNQNKISSQDILLSLIDECLEEDSVAKKIFERMEIDLSNLRSTLIEMMKETK